MTRAEYEQYEASVAKFLAEHKIRHLYPVDPGAEPYFSWQPCDVCGDSLGGNREDCKGYSAARRKMVGPFRVCENCVYYTEYGQLDDLTMLNLDKEGT